MLLVEHVTAVPPVLCLQLTGAVFAFNSLNALKFSFRDSEITQREQLLAELASQGGTSCCSHHPVALSGALSGVIARILSTGGLKTWTGLSST